MSTGATTTEPHSEMVPIDVTGILRRKFWFILFFILCGFGIGALYYFKAPKTYQSWARLFVDEQKSPTLGNSNKEAFGDEQRADEIVAKYIEVFRSSSVVGPAIVNDRLGTLPSMQDVDSVRREIDDHLTAKPADTKSNSGVMWVAYSGPDPDDCQKILAALINSFDTYIQESRKDLGTETVSLIDKLEHTLKEQIQDAESRRAEIMTRPTLMFKDGTAVNSHQEQISKYQFDLDDLRRERTQIKSRMEQIQHAKENGVNPESMVVDALQGGDDRYLGGYVTTQQQYVELRIKEQQLLAEFGSDHPDVRAVRNQLQAVNVLRLQELSRMRGATVSGDELPDLTEVYLTSVKARLELMDGEEKSILDSIEKEHEEAAKINSDLDALDSVNREINRLDAEFAAATARLKEISVFKDFQWRKLNRLDEATVAEQISPSLLISFLASLALGSLAGFGFATLMEMAEKRFRSSDEIANLLGSRVISHIHAFHRNGRKNRDYQSLRGDVVAIHRPDSQAAEAYRGIRTAPLLPSPVGRFEDLSNHQPRSRRRQVDYGRQPGDCHGTNRPKNLARRRRLPATDPAKTVRHGKSTRPVERRGR